MNEAYLATTRKRVSLARHARLMDYHLHEGNQASTWLALEIAGGPGAVHARRSGARRLDRRRVRHCRSRCSSPAASDACRRRSASASIRWLNRLRLHTWRDAQPALRAGSTSADIVPTVRPRSGSRRRRAARSRASRHAAREMLIAELLNPLTGARARAQPAQAPAAAAARRRRPPIAERHDLSIRSPTPGCARALARRRRAALRLQLHDLLQRHAGGNHPVEDVSMFFGNLCRCTRDGRWK